MAHQAEFIHKASFIGRLSPNYLLIGLAALLAGSSYFAPNDLSQLAALLAALTVFLTAVFLSLHSRRERRKDQADLVKAGQLAQDDPSAVFCTDVRGGIIFQNAAALERFGPQRELPMSKALSGLIPNASAVVFRHEAALAQSKNARETIVTRKGAIKLTAFPVGSGRVWRVEETFDAQQPRGTGWIGLPMMVVSQKDTILSMNEALRLMLGRRMRALSDVFETLPIKTGERTMINGADGPVDVVAVELQAGDGRREIYALPMELLPTEDSVAARAFEALPVALIHIGPDGKILAANPQAQNLLNFKGLHLGLGEIVEGLGRPIIDWLTDTLEGRIPPRPEVVRAALREEDCFVQITLGRIQGKSGASLLGVLHDSTELKTMEQQFVQSQKMQAIGELAGGVAHDFNNLLTAITGHCDLLLLRHDEGEPDYADLVQINQNANRAASLVGQLLAFSRKQTMQPEVLDLRDTMPELTHLLNRLVGERVQLKQHHDPGLLPIRADRRQLDQVIMNLVVNARDAMPDGGEIEISTRVENLTEPLLRDQAEVAPGQYVTIRVTDEGTGISPEQISRIFEPFFTTKRTGEGTGLGLSMVYGIVKQSGGFVFAESTPGEGTEFTLYFPVHDMPAEDILPKPEIVPERLAHLPGDGVILLVEDEASVRAFASRALRMRGFTVLEAESAEEALDKLEDSTLSVDVFVTDVIMPGMDGPTWVREALKDRPDVKVVFVSGYAEDAFEKTSDGVPNSVFLAKPFSLSDLTSTVQRQLH